MISKRHTAKIKVQDEGCLRLVSPQIVLSYEWDANNPSLPPYSNESQAKAEKAMAALAEQFLKKGQVYELRRSIPSEFSRTLVLSLIICVSTRPYGDMMWGQWWADFGMGVTRKFMRVET